MVAGANVKGKERGRGDQKGDVTKLIKDDIGK